MANNTQDTHWWKTVPGILSGLAALVTAIGGLILAFHEAGILDKQETSNGNPPSIEKKSNEPSENNSPIKPDVIEISGIKLPAYVVLDSAWKTKKEAQRQLVTLNHAGYSNIGFFWIPDFDFLSGAELYQVYIGPFENRTNAINEICKYNQKLDKDTYGIKLSIKPGRDEFRCKD